MYRFDIFFVGFVVTAVKYSVTVTITVTEALLLRPLLEDRGRITEYRWPFHTAVLSTAV